MSKRRPAELDDPDRYPIRIEGGTFVFTGVLANIEPKYCGHFMAFGREDGSWWCVCCGTVLPPPEED